MSQEIIAQPLTATAFAPFGDILEAKGTADKIINQGLCGRFHDLARLDFSVDSNDRRDASELVSECLKQLEKHPLDNQTREQLARVYFNRYGKPDLAWEELNKLFANPFQQPRDLARWLNLMADWHLEKNNPDGARQCLQQVIARFPDLPFAEEAQARLTRMQDVV